MESSNYFLSAELCDHCPQDLYLFLFKAHDISYTSLIFVSWGVQQHGTTNTWSLHNKLTILVNPEKYVLASNCKLRTYNFY